MLTLEEHNQRRMNNHKLLEIMKKPHPNGIACPECGKELWDSNPMFIKASIPPQLDIHCPACDYRGYRIA